MVMMRLLALAALLAIYSYDVTNANVVADCKVDLVLVIDNSMSISGTVENHAANPSAYPSWGRQITFAKSLVQQLHVQPDGTHVGLVDFGDDGYLDFDLKTYSTVDQVIAGIDKLQYKAGLTATHAGLKLAGNVLLQSAYGGRDDVPKVIILITDGAPSYPDKMPPVLADLRENEIRIVVVFIDVGGKNIANEPQMKAMASSEKDYVRVESFANLDGVKDRIINADTCRHIAEPIPDPVTTTTTTTTTRKPLPPTTTTRSPPIKITELPPLLEATEYPSTILLIPYCTT